MHNKKSLKMFKSPLFAIFLNTAAKGCGITHIVHPALQTDTHHATTLTDSLQSRGQFYLTDMVAIDLTLHNVLM